MKRIGCLLLLMVLLLTSFALAEDVCRLDSGHAGQCITSDKNYLSVSYTLETESEVVLTICDQWGYITYQRNYGLCQGDFLSEDIYLPLSGDETTYAVSLTAGNALHCFTVTRVTPRISDSTVSSAGLSMQEISGSSSTRRVCLLDIAALSTQPPMVVPMLSGDVQLGTVAFSVRNGELCVSAELTADGRIDRASVYVAKTYLSAQTLGTRRFDGKKKSLDQTFDVSDTNYAAVLVQLSVTYDQSTATPAIPDDAFLQEQQRLWETMQLETPNEAVG